LADLEVKFKDLVTRKVEEKAGKSEERAGRTDAEESR